MYIETLLQLLDASGQDVMKYAKKFKPAPFYSDEIYNITFGSQDCDIAPLAKVLKDAGMTKGKKSLELFGGSSFESMLLQKEIPGNNYFSIDINDYFTKYRGIKYVKGSVYEHPSASEHGKYDFAFVGATNKSLCTVLRLRDITGLALYMSKVVATNGIIAVSYFNDSSFGEDQNFIIDITEPQKIRWAKKYKGFWAHWMMVTHRNVTADTHVYYPVVFLTKTEKLSAPVHCFYSPDGGTFRSWSDRIITEVFSSVGFSSYTGEKNIYDGYSVFSKNKPYI